MIYKNGQFLFFGEESFAKVEAIYGSRFAGPFLFFTLGFSYYPNKLRMGDHKISFTVDVRAARSFA